MAFVMPLRARFDLVDRILNVSQKVGDSRDSPNLRDDVLAVQKLLVLAAVGPGARFPEPTPTGVYDPTTAYYIYHIQQRQHAARPGSTVDGVMSPARNGSPGYGPGLHTIVILNNIARNANQSGWETLLSQFAIRAN
ncbi:hypothetical protein [Alsobacter sp. SYSU BS001988]